MAYFVNAFLLAFFDVLKTKVFIGFFAVVFIVFSFVLFRCLINDLTGVQKNGD